MPDRSEPVADDFSFPITSGARRVSASERIPDAPSTDRDDLSPAPMGYRHERP
jgi:hypothetical protein